MTVHERSIVDQIIAHSRREHLRVEDDIFYSCSMTEDRQGWVDKPYCDCGADLHNKRLDELVQLLTTI